jgi:two-component system, response regulator PdtaR
VRPRVLIIEDDPFIGREFQEAVAEAGYEVLGPARSMAAGLYLAQLKVPDLAIVDIGLAGTIDGIEGGRRLRLELGLPVIFISGHGDPKTRARAAAIRPAAFLEKPCSSPMLIEAIRHAIELQGPRRAAETAAGTSLGEKGFGTNPAG